MKDFKIHYLGDDPDFILIINQGIKQEKNEIQFSTSLDSPITPCVEMNPNIIFVDFTLPRDMSLHIEQIVFLKKTVRYKPILFVGIFRDEDHLKQFDFIFSSGFQLSFIKGGEIHQLLLDCLFMASGGLGSQTVFAEAQALRKKVNMGVCSSIATIDTETLVIETDVETSNKVLKIQQRIFPELVEAEVTEKKNIATHYPMMATCHLKLPEFDPWADDSNISIPPEKIATWIDLHQDHFKEKKGNVLVIDATFSFLNEVYALEQKSELSYLYLENLQESLGHITVLRPELILIGQTEKSEDTIAKLELLANLIRRESFYSPILVATNMPSSSSAIQKLINYNYVICFPGILTNDLIKKFSLMYSEKKLIQKIDHTYTLTTTSNYRTLDVNLEIIIQKLNEHEITFEMSQELPMFTNLHFHVPTEFYATLIPFKSFKSSISERITYKALIHGICEERLELFRQFINALILNPDMSFEVSKEKLTALPAKDNIPKSPQSKTRPSSDELSVRYQGKSKL